MRAVDTNLLVRLITRDDEAQLAAAEEFVAAGAWISHLVLAELSWVLESVYERTRSEIAKAVEMLLDHERLAVQEQEVVATALRRFRTHSRVSFSDALILEIAHKNGHVPLGTFDRQLAKLDAAHWVRETLK
jgi:predicted nucleic-acid-binding protein